jgi:hypothetical protein
MRRRLRRGYWYTNTVLTPGEGCVTFEVRAYAACVILLALRTSTGRDYWLRSPVIFLFAGSLPQRTGELGLSVHSTTIM